MVIPVGLRGVGQEFPEDISPCAGGVLLVAGSHEGGTHGAAGKLGFAAVAGTVALFRMLQDILAMEPEDRRKSRGLLTRFVPQHGVHGRCVHDLSRVEDIFRVPGMLDLLHEPVVPFTDHLRDEHDLKPKAIDGTLQTAWIVLDYFDVIIHVMRADVRDRYDLEALWGDAPRIKPRARSSAKA